MERGRLLEIAHFEESVLRRIDLDAETGCDGSSSIRIRARIEYQKDPIY